MKLVSVTCNNCGAPLEIPPATRFVTCGFCSSRLEVHHSGSALYTHVLEQLKEQTRQIAVDVEVLKRQNELEQLDREWMMERERFQSRSRDGRYHVPTVTGSVVGAAIAVGFAIFWIAMASAMRAPTPFVLFGILFVGVAIVGGIVGVTKATSYQQCKKRYEQRRREVLRRLETPDR